MSVDVIFGEIVREYFETVAREMNTTMDNTSLSPVFNEAHDCSAGLFFFDGKEVSLIARALAEPVHIFASVHSVEGLIRYYRNDLADGDIIMVNDPYFFGEPHSRLDGHQAGFPQQQAGLLPGHPGPHDRGGRAGRGWLQLRRSATCGRRVSGSRRSSCTSAASCVATCSIC